MRRENLRIVVVDDHEEMVLLLADQLRDEGFSVEVATDGRKGVTLVERLQPDLVITDLRMKGFDGFDVLEATRAIDPEIPVLIMTAFGAVESAVEAIRRGAFHYFTKPFRLDEVLLWVERSLEDRELKSEIRRLKAQAPHAHGIIGESAAMHRLRDRISRFAIVDAPVLIRGESGTGKELVARALHLASSRRDAPFVAVNCTSLPQELLESELFGHTKGAFTGAMTARRGLFVEADGGTLFLDEIGDMPPELQAKLLRVLQEREIRAVGSDTTRRIDVRILAATHQPLETQIRNGKFREDLFFRLNVLNLDIPSLHERRDDIPELSEAFFERYRLQYGSTLQRIPADVMVRLQARQWRGNVRELENVIQRFVILGELEDVPQTSEEDEVGLISLRELEERHVRRVLAHCHGNKTHAAEILGIDASTLHRKLARSSE